jgi:hypothetical protein
MSEARDISNEVGTKETASGHCVLEPALKGNQHAETVRMRCGPEHSQRGFRVGGAPQSGIVAVMCRNRRTYPGHTWRQTSLRIVLSPSLSTASKSVSYLNRKSYRQTRFRNAVILNWTTHTTLCLYSKHGCRSLYACTHAAWPPTTAIIIQGRKHRRCASMYTSHQPRHGVPGWGHGLLHRVANMDGVHQH